jgi:hypothetical protein
MAKYYVSLKMQHIPRVLIKVLYGDPHLRQVPTHPPPDYVLCENPALALELAMTSIHDAEDTIA